MIEILRKKLLYMSKHRGCKEMDIILGRFAESQLNILDDEELSVYQRVLALPDDIIYAMLVEVLLDKKNQHPKIESEAKSVVVKIAMFCRNNGFFTEVA